GERGARGRRAARRFGGGCARRARALASLYHWGRRLRGHRGSTACGRSRTRVIRPAFRRRVAQSGSAPRSGRGGRRFKSCHSDQHLASPETSIPTVSPTDTCRSGYCRRQLLANAAMADLARRLVAVRRRALLIVATRRCPQPWLAYRRGSTLHDTEADLVIPCLDSQSGEAAPTTLFSTDGLPGFFPDRFSRRSTSSPTAGAGVSRRRLDKQQ